MKNVRPLGNYFSIQPNVERYETVPPFLVYNPNSGNPAVYFKRPVAFRPHLTMDLALYRKELSSQQANDAY
jgi:hypothetical protein